MEEKAIKRAASGAIILIVLLVVLVILPMLYLLSVGPVVWMFDRGMIVGNPNPFVERVYSPLNFACEKCEPLERMMVWYISWWGPVKPTVQPAPVTK